MQLNKNGVLHTNGSGMCRALEISEVHNYESKTVIRTVCEKVIELKDEMLSRYNPVEGDFFVTQEADGYQYVCPGDVFVEKYRSSGDLTYSDALFLLKAGFKLAREGWNGKKMFVYFVPGSRFKVQGLPLAGVFPDGSELEYRSHLDMRHSDGTVGVWLASHSDQLEDDWVIVE